MRTGVNFGLKRFSVYWFDTPQGAVPLQYGFPRRTIAGLEEKDGRVWALGNARTIGALTLPSGSVLLA